MTRCTRSVPARAAGVATTIKVQTAPVKAPSRLSFSLALVLCAAVGAASCGREIGDECVTPADCNPNGSRACDTSQPGGYCTIIGCDATSCPEEAVCIRYFPAEFLTLPCNPCCEDWPAQSPPPPGCAADSCPNGPLDECTADEISPRARVRPAIDRAPVLCQGLRQQRRLSWRLRVPAGGNTRQPGADDVGEPDGPVLRPNRALTPKPARGAAENRACAWLSSRSWSCWRRRRPRAPARPSTASST